VWVIALFLFVVVIQRIVWRVHGRFASTGLSTAACYVLVCSLFLSLCVCRRSTRGNNETSRLEIQCRRIATTRPRRLSGAPSLLRIARKSCVAYPSCSTSGALRQHFPDNHRQVLVELRLIHTLAEPPLTSAAWTRRMSPTGMSNWDSERSFTNSYTPWKVEC
jgi:hypothetical protein